MDIGIIGLPQSGKTTIFNCLTGGHAESTGHGGQGQRHNVGMAKVPDPRLQGLAEIFHPKRIVNAEVRYMDVPFTPKGLGKSEGFSGQLLHLLSQTDALLHVVRRFEDPSVSHIEGSIDPMRDIESMDLELAYSDLTILERRRARLDDHLKGARAQERAKLLEQQALMGRIKEGLENEVCIRDQTFSPEERKSLSDYQFLTDKPLLLVLNIGEDDLPAAADLQAELDERYGGPGVKVVAVCGKLEQELSQLDESEAEEFRSALGGGEPATEQVIRITYELLGLVSFLTYGPEEVRAWPVDKGIEAVKAAGKVHSDMERGFIRAEVLGYDEMVSCGSIAEARKRGVLRLEGKTYNVQDGDVITFLFNV